MLCFDFFYLIFVNIWRYIVSVVNSYLTNMESWGWDTAQRICLWELLSLLLPVSTSSSSSASLFLTKILTLFNPLSSKGRVSQECMAGKQDGKAYCGSAVWAAMWYSVLFHLSHVQSIHYGIQWKWASTIVMWLCVIRWKQRYCKIHRSKELELCCWLWSRVKKPLEPFFQLWSWTSKEFSGNILLMSV